MAKMTTCKSCHKEIAKSAKTCPNCGAKNKRKGVFFYLILAVVAIILIDVIANSGKDSSNTSTTASSTETIYEVGTTIVSPKFELTVTSAERRTSVGNEFFKSEPSEGGIFVAISYKYKNISDKPISTFSTPSFRLLDPQGNRYSEDIDASGSFATEFDDLDEKILSSVNPGITVKGTGVFEVAEELLNEGQWKILIDADKDFYITFN